MNNPTDSTPSMGEPVAFKAEIRQLLDILVHSLYKEREIFLRELLSNASDALNRARFEMLTNREMRDPDTELTIRISADAGARTLTITDTGIGMTAEELVDNLGTIARSGARAFLDVAKETAAESMPNLSDIIGQFGVGFYSVFMVAEWVRVTSLSYRPEAEAAVWSATGEGTYTVSSTEKTTRGTTVEIKLTAEAEEFAQEPRLREIVRKHSNYIQFPIYVGLDEQPANQLTALWRQSPREVAEAKYNDFYKQLTLDFEPPLEHVHLVIDAPLRLYALLFFPATAERSIFSLRKEDGLKLYARKVLIQEYCLDLLPEYYRFVQGVVDAEDLPLNVSRETVQSNALMVRLKKILTGRVTGTLKAMAKDQEKPGPYTKFWETFGRFIKQGIATDPDERQNLAPLLRFRTTRAPQEWASLDQYVGRLKPAQRKIYFLLGEDVHSMLRSPHLDYFTRHGYEVLLLHETIDSFMLLSLPKYEGFDLQNIAAPNLELPEAGPGAEEPQAQPLSSAAFDALVARFEAHLGDRVSEVRATNRLSGSIARLVDPEGTLNQEMQRVYKLLEKDFEAPKKVLELNPRHPTLARLMALPEESELNAPVIEQIYENALLIEGLHPDPASMLPRLERLIAAALPSVP